MPTYTFRDPKGKEWTEFMSISERDVYLAANPKVAQVPAAPFIGDPMLQGLKKPDEGFRDLLKEMKRKHRSLWNPCTINTW